MRGGIALCWIKRGSSLIVIQRRKVLPPLGSFDRGFSVRANSGRVLDPHVRRARKIGAAACSRNERLWNLQGLRYSNYAALRDTRNLAATKGSTSTFKRFCFFGPPNNGLAVVAYRVSRWASGEARLRNRSNAGTSDARDELRRMRSTHP
jgi:hypothetical protein